MNYQCTRRQFLGATAFSTISLAGFGALPPDSRESGLASVHVVFGSQSAGARSQTWIYLREILARAGVFFEEHSPSRIERITRVPGAILVLAGNLSLSKSQRDTIADWVREGGTLLGIGGSSGLKEVFGVASETPLADGWIRPTRTDHRIVANLRSSLHVFGGYTATPSTATVLAGIQSGSAFVKGNAILENGFGNGRAVLLGPDLLFSVVHIQQGVPVLQDGRPAPDGLGPVNDGVLKAEDGSVLDWARDRSPVAPEGQIFLEPVTDELRELILRSLFHLAAEQGRSMAVLWQWPGAAKAVATMSHDTDGNNPELGASLLEVVRRCDVKTTWCILYPGGYPKPFYRELVDAGCEVALHYDAMSGGEKTSWSWENFQLQQEWLMREAGVKEITTNKNHYTRWEGSTELWRWCEEAGIRSDQTRGPSKKATIGFPLGGSQPYYPLDQSSGKTRFMRVLEVNLLTQDLVVTCPPDYGEPLVTSAMRHHGVAHFLFHPAHIKKPGVADALENVVNFARKAGLEWWTSRQIVDWESHRREVEGSVDLRGLRLKAGKPLENATVLFLRPSQQPVNIDLDGKPAVSTLWQLYGFPFDAVTTRLHGSVNLGCRV